MPTSSIGGSRHSEKGEGEPVLFIGGDARAHLDAFSGQFRAISMADEPGDARGQYPGLAGARSGQDQRVFGGEFNSSALLRIQGVAQGGWEQHRGIVGSR